MTDQALVDLAFSMLERSYTSSTAHVDRPTTAEDSSILRVENYRELVSAVLYLVSEGAEESVSSVWARPMASMSWSNDRSRPPPASARRRSMPRVCPPPPRVQSTYMPDGLMFNASSDCSNRAGMW